MNHQTHSFFKFSFTKSKNAIKWAQLINAAIMMQKRGRFQTSILFGKFVFLEKIEFIPQIIIEVAKKAKAPTTINKILFTIGAPCQNVKIFQIGSFTINEETVIQSILFVITFSFPVIWGTT